MNKNKTNTFFFVWRGLVSALSGNKGSAPLKPKDVNLIVDPELYHKMIGKYQNGDPFIIEKIGLEKNILKLKLAYGGGSKVHHFDVLWNGSYAKYNPFQIRLIIKHRSNIDMCKAYINQMLEIDLQELMGQSYLEPISVHVFNAYDGSILN